MSANESHKPYITCRELIDFIADYLDGSLAAEPRREFERHLAACPPCVHYLRSYEATVALEKAATRPDAAEAPVEVPEALIRAILAAREKGAGG